MVCMILDYIIDNYIMSIDGGLPHFCNSSSIGRCWNGSNNEEMDIMRTDFDDSIENQGSTINF